MSVTTINQTREERGKGIPKGNIERVMSHYGIDEETARYWLTIHSVEELLPERGTGLETGRARGLALYNPQPFWRWDNPWLWLVGLGLGILLFRRK